MYVVKQHYALTGKWHSYGDGCCGEVIDSVGSTVKEKKKKKKKKKKHIHIKSIFLSRFWI